MGVRSSERFLVSVIFIKTSPIPVLKNIKIGNKTINVVFSVLTWFLPFPPTTKHKAVKANTMPVVWVNPRAYLRKRTPNKVGMTTESLLDSEVTVTPERWLETTIST